MTPNNPNIDCYRVGAAADSMIGLSPQSGMKDPAQRCLPRVLEGHMYIFNQPSIKPNEHFAKKKGFFICRKLVQGPNYSNLGRDPEFKNPNNSRRHTVRIAIVDC